MGLGLCGGGVGSAGFFRRKGAHVTVTDLRSEEELSGSVSALEGTGVTFHLGGHSDGDFLDADIVVASPAVRPDSPYLSLAASRGIPVECPAALFFRITLPAAWRGVLAGAVLAFARAMGEFGATLMFAGNIPGRTNTMPLELYAAYQQGADARALFYVAVLTGLSLAVVTIASRLAPSGEPA